jgi:opacity protein-like surface antigen
MPVRIAALGFAFVLLWSPSVSADQPGSQVAYLMGVAAVATVSMTIAANADPDRDYDHSGFYLGGSATGGFSRFQSGLPSDIKVDDSFGAGAQLGYRFHPRAAAEAEFEWLGRYFGSVDVDGGEIDLFRIGSWTATGNAKGYLLTGSIQPYGLVGVGVMRSNIKDALGLDLSGKSTDLALRFGAGVECYVFRKFVTTIGVDYLHPTGDQKDLNYVSVQVGLQYRF